MAENTNKDKKEKKELDPLKEQDCTSIENPEMARNYEEEEPCNDGTISH
ncbi:MAG: hypothetical protein JXR70_09475 [Spirochaetales bacterium]|nr:hypothetical protein [Spirochaetales bacterium]